MTEGAHRVDAELPYYSVIFTSQRSDADDEGYAQMADRMMELAGQAPGFLGVDSVRDAAGLGLTISYWRDLDSIAAWKRDTEHLLAQGEGRRRWYDAYRLRIAKVERDYGFARGADAEL